MPPPPRRVALMLDLDWPYQRHVGIFAGTQRYAEQHAWECTIDEFADETLSRDSRPVPYDGVIARATNKLERACRRRGVPLVNAWSNSPVADRAPSVLPDAAAAGRLAAEHLMARGLHHFAALASYGSRASQSSCEAFADAVREAGRTCPIDKVPNTPAKTFGHWKKTEQTIRRWMESWTLPIGVYVGHDSTCRLLAQLCQRRRWRVPEDVALITGTNEPLLCEHPRPSLTSIDLGYERVGYEAAQLLDNLMEARNRNHRGRKNAPVKQILLPPQGLVMRQSTDFFAVDDPTVAAALRFISDHSHKPIGVEDVASAAHTGKRTLQNRFRKSLNRSIAAEVRRVRIERAKRELAQGTQTLAAIARDVGFGTSQRLCDVFRRDVGVSPGEYRKQWR